MPGDSSFTLSSSRQSDLEEIARKKHPSLRISRKVAVTGESTDGPFPAISEVQTGLPSVSKISKETTAEPQGKYAKRTSAPSSCRIAHLSHPLQMGLQCRQLFAGKRAQEVIFVTRQLPSLSAIPPFECPKRDLVRLRHFARPEKRRSYEPNRIPSCWPPCFPHGSPRHLASGAGHPVPLFCTFPATPAAAVGFPLHRPLRRGEPTPAGGRRRCA